MTRAGKPATSAARTCACRAGSDHRSMPTVVTSPIPTTTDEGPEVWTVHVGTSPLNNSTRDVLKCGSLVSRAPPAAPPSGASTGPPRPDGSPGGAGGAAPPSALTASPPPPSCTRPRAGPSRGGARDAPRDGNAAKMARVAHRAGLPHLLGGVRRPAGVCDSRLAWGHVHGDHHPLRGRRRRSGRGGAGLPAGPGGRAGHAPRIPARLRPPVPWRRAGPARARGSRRSGARRSAARRRAAPHRDAFVWRTPTRADRWPTTGARARNTRTTRWSRRAGSCRSWCRRPLASRDSASRWGRGRPR